MRLYGSIKSLCTLNNMPWLKISYSGTLVIAYWTFLFGHHVSLIFRLHLWLLPPSSLQFPVVLKTDSFKCKTSLYPWSKNNSVTMTVSEMGTVCILYSVTCMSISKPLKMTHFHCFTLSLLTFFLFFLFLSFFLFNFLSSPLVNLD